MQIQYAQNAGEAPNAQGVKDVTLPAMMTTQLALDNPPAGAGLQNSFIINSNGAPGDLMAKLVSTSDSGLHEVEILGKDEKSGNGGSHPWSLEPGNEASLILFNPGAEPRAFTVLISGGEVFWEKVYELSSMQTQEINIRNLVLNSVADDKGKTLPPASQSGVIEWFGSGDGKGRLLESNKELGMARNFSCTGYYCLCQPTFLSGTTTFPVLSTVGFGSIEGDICQSSYPGPCCNQGSVAQFNTLSYPFSWSSGNTSIAQISGSSTSQSVNLYGAGTGSATETGQICDTSTGCCIQQQPPANVTPTVQASCQSAVVPLRTGSSTGANSETCTATNLNPPSGGTFSWSASNSNVSLTNTSSQTVTVTGANKSANQGDTKITVAYTYPPNNGQTAQSSVNITVVQPTSLPIPATTDNVINPTGHTCTAGYTGSPTCAQSGYTGSGSYTSYSRNRSYHILDQFTNWIQGYPLDIQESYGPPTGQCASDRVITGPPSTGDTVSDCFYFCSDTCRTGGSCSVSGTQTITVNGFSVRTENVTWTCSSVTLSP